MIKGKKMLDQIKVCLFLSNQNSVKMVTEIMLNMGIISFNSDTPDAALNILKNNKIDFIFVDFDFANNISFELMDKIKADTSLSNIFVIGTSFNSNEKFIKQLQKYYIISYMVKPLSADNIRDKIQKIVLKFKDHFPQRKHVRVDPTEDELVRISFQLKKGKNISAKVLNISLGGLACEMYTNLESEELEPGNLIQPIIFEVGNREIEVDAKIISKKDRFIAVKFTKFFKNSYESLTKYIMKKLSV
jgi:response regulator RpfG family c-di-GMP phosphodiesterase